GRHDGRRLATEGAEIEGCSSCVCHDQANCVDGQPQLLRDHLAERGADVLADLDLASEGGDLAFLADVQPGREVARQVAEAPAGSLTRPLTEGVSHGQADQDAAAEHTKEVAPIEVELVERFLEQFVALRFDVGSQLEIILVHLPPPFSSLAAWRMAWT